MRIAEIYQSRQGEGKLTGTSSAFVRTSGCNLRCWFCDTPYTSWQAEGEDLSVREIVQRVMDLGCRHVVVTGGEPMLYAELIPLCDRLSREGHHLTIETAGTLYLPLPCDLMSISPKLSNSTPSFEQAGAWQERHDRARTDSGVIQRLIREYSYQLKFVVNRPEDLEETQSYLAGYPEVPFDRVWLMPQGTDLAAVEARGEWLEPYCQQHGFHYCPRRQLEWFGLVRGT